MVLSIANFFRRMHRREEGFTLIELLIVIAILAVLAAIAIPLVVNRIDQARKSADLANVAQLQSAVDLFVLDKGSGKETLAEVELPIGICEEGVDTDWMTPLVTHGYLQKYVVSPYGDKGYELSSKHVVTSKNEESYPSE